MEYKPIAKNGNSSYPFQTFLNLPYKETLENEDWENIDFVMTGVCFDTLVTNRPGTRKGPDAVRAAYGPIGFSDEFNLSVWEYMSGVDSGNIVTQNGQVDFSFQNITEAVKTIRSAGVIPIIIGGDHSIAFPELMGYKEAMGPVAILHFDSHSDTGYRPMTEDAPYNHGTPFKDAINNGCIDTAHSCQVGMRGLTTPEAKDYAFAVNAGMKVIPAHIIHEIGLRQTASQIREKLGDAPVFVTFDIDFLDPVYAPGTGTPEGCGFSTWEALELLRMSLIGKNIVGFDLVEIAPQYDAGEITAQAGKRILFEFLSILAAGKAGIKSYKGIGENNDIA